MDLIERAAAIDSLRVMQTYKLCEGDDMLLIDQAEAQTELMMLPPAQPEPINPCTICQELIARDVNLGGRNERFDQQTGGD